MKDLPNSLNLDEWIAAALLEELTPEERQTFDLYLQENPNAHALYNQTTSMTHLIESSFADARPGPSFENRMIHAFRQRTNYHGSWILEFLQNAFRLPAVYIPATAILLFGLVQLGTRITGPMEYGIVSGVHNYRAVLLDSSKLFAGRIGNKEYNSSTAVDAGTLSLRNESSEELEQKGSKRIVVAPTGLAIGKQMPADAFFAGAAGGFTGSSSIKKPLWFATAVGHTYANSESSKALDIPMSQRALPTGNLASLTPVASPSAPSSSSSQLQTAQLPPTTDSGVIDNRKLVRNASLDLEVKNYDAALDSITSIASGNSGYVATKNSARLPNGKMSGTIVIKVLPDRLDAALLQIRALGELKNQSLSTRDVTKEYFDTDARLRNSRKMEERLLALLDTMKGKISELLAVEKELARVREEIEQMQGQLKLYDSLVQYATITISLREKDLNEAAAYLLKESVTLSLFSADVEKSYESARREADADKAQIVQSRLVRDDSGRVTGVLTLLIAPDAADGLIARVKALGRVQNFNKEDQRVAQDGSENSSTAKIERDKVQLNLTILPDDESRKQVALTVITKEVETAFENAKAAVTAQGATILNTDLQHPGGDSTSATLTVRVPAKNYTALLETFKKTGIVSQFAIQRDDTRAEDAASAPVLIAFTLTNADQPVQFTQAAILTTDVETQASNIKQAAAKPDSQIEVKTSTFERTPDGRQNATLVLRLPLVKYQAFLGEIEKLGKLKDLSVRREDRTDTATTELATVQITLQLYSQGNVVTEDNGLFTTMRKTLGQAVASLMWSVRMIGVALAFVVPWALALALLIWITRKISNRKSKTPDKTPKD